MSAFGQSYPRRRSRWLYTGPGFGTGLVHTVVGDPRVEGDIQRSEVITLSDGVIGEEGVAGYSWLGSFVDFTRYFRPLEGQSK